MDSAVTRSEFKQSMADIGANFQAVFDRFDCVDERFDRLERTMDLRFNRLDGGIQILKDNQIVMVGALNSIMDHFGIKNQLLVKQ